MDGCPCGWRKKSSYWLYTVAQDGKKDLVWNRKNGHQAEEILCYHLHLHKSQGEKNSTGLCSGRRTVLAKKPLCCKSLQSRKFRKIWKNLKFSTSESNKRQMSHFTLDMNVQVLDIQTVRMKITHCILLFHELGSIFLS